MRTLILLFLVTGCREDPIHEKDTQDSSPGIEDADGDGYTDECDDNNPDVFPGATEVCDGLDNDCDNQVDEDAIDAGTWYADADDDGFGDPAIEEVACEAPTGFVANAEDCDDTDARFNPGTVESDCEDPNDYNCDGSVGWTDADADGFAACNDCDDSDADRNEDAAEVCNGLDDNCNGFTDDNDPEISDGTLYYGDSDGDGHGGQQYEAIGCEAPAGYVDNSNDCNDLDPLTYPGAAEICDESDNDCDGGVDEGVEFTWYADGDGDGYGDAAATTTACVAPPGYSSNGNDCDDTASQAHPGGIEICNGQDDDCDGTIDGATAINASTYYADADGDGYGDAGSTTIDCEAPTNHVSDDSDCDDTSAASHPGADEVCDGADNDCDGTTDEASATDASTWYADADSDNYGNPASSQVACNAPSGHVADNTDCNDVSATINPGAPEVCDSIDNDCDSTVDQNAVDSSTWWRDQDGDGHGDLADSLTDCNQPTGYVGVNGTADAQDCNDTDATVNPDATEVCDSIDNNCDGVADEGSATDALTWFADSDTDGFGDPSTTTTACTQPSGFVADASDCNDNDGASETTATDGDCDGTLTAEDCDDADSGSTVLATDGDCDGTLTADDCDDADSGSTVLATDGDCDGFGQAEGDCDDADPNVYPNNPEVCDSIDNNCNGNIDEGMNGSAAACAATDCSAILSENASSPDGNYWIDPNSDGAGQMEVYCDMSTDGGGWALIMTTSSSSAYNYDHAVWTDTSGGSSSAANPSAQQDYVSAAFYELSGTESRLALGATSNWNSWYHADNTARNLSNQPRMSGSYGSNVNCSAQTNCGTEPINKIPLGVENGCSNTYSSRWQRFGYINDVNGWGTKTRVGYSGDNDGSDSSDTVMGLGLHCSSSCLTAATSGSAHGQGSGYYFYSGWATSPYDGALAGWLWIR